MNKKIKYGLSIVIVISALILVFVANKMQQKREMKEPEILIKVDGQTQFLSKDELILRIKRKQLVFPGQTYADINVPAIETYISKMQEVLTVNVYKKMGDNWNIEVQTRRPIARIFNNRGQSFYLDTRGHTMQPAFPNTARVVVVNGDIPDPLDGKTVEEVINNPALKSIRILDDVYRISHYVCNNPFFVALIGQIYRLKNGDFILIPQVGEQRIVFGTAKTDAEVLEKFNKLEIFYKQALAYEGWEKYETINLKYKKQIVCRKKEVDKEVEI